MRHFFFSILFLMATAYASVVQARTLIFNSKKDAEAQCEVIRYIGPVVVVAKSLDSNANKRAMFEELLKKSLEKKGTAVYLIGGKKNAEGQWVIRGVSIICKHKAKEQEVPSLPVEPVNPASSSDPAKLQDQKKDSEPAIPSTPLQNKNPELVPDAVEEKTDQTKT